MQGMEYRRRCGTAWQQLRGPRIQRDDMSITNAVSAGGAGGGDGEGGSLELEGS
jgi:hypothetical protein